ncbi:MAG: hypothetical protein FWE54_00285 [Methanimicrococcus sp.]|nr:hypothetical protein [Methanimicrococcus sp.]
MKKLIELLFIILIPLAIIFLIKRHLGCGCCCSKDKKSKKDKRNKCLFTSLFK